MFEAKSKKRIGIIRGGDKEHYASSLEKGGDIILYIFENFTHKYKPVDILIDKDYVWHLNGLPINPADLMNRVDVVWNTSHPSFSNVVESLSIPNLGLNPFSKTLSSSKEMLKNHMNKIGFRMPRSIVLPVYQRDFDGPQERYSIKKAKEVFEKFPSPWIVRSFTDNPNMGIHLAKTFGELAGAIEDGLQHGTSILVEEFIRGNIASVHSLSKFRGEDVYVFPPLNIFGEISHAEKEKLAQIVKELHKHIGAKHYLKSSFILSGRGQVYLTHIDATPDLKAGSYFSKACESVGTKMFHVVEHMLEQA